MRRRCSHLIRKTRKRDGAQPSELERLRLRAASASLVTGASHGIGLASRTAFARAGAELHHPLEHARHRRRGGAIAQGRRPPGARRVCDITDRAAVRRAVGGLGALDVLVNNAGLELMTPIHEPGDEVEPTFRRIIEINVIGTYYVTRAALPLMPAAAASSSPPRSGAKIAEPLFAAYVASKHAIIGLMRVLAEGARAARHQRQRGLPRLGADARRAALARPKCPQRPAVERGRAAGTDSSPRRRLPGLMEPDDIAEPLSLPRLRSAPPTSPGRRSMSIAARCAW